MSSLVIPEGFRVHEENGAKLLLPEGNEAFLNPVQEFNRDISVASIRVWSEQINELKEKKWNERWKRKELTSPESDPKRRKVEHHNSFKDTPHNATADEALLASTSVGQTNQNELKSREYAPHKVTILEPLSATGLRSIRFAQEIPLVKYVIANDLSPAATEIMRRNVLYNGLGPDDSPPHKEGTDIKENTTIPQNLSLGKVRVNEGDACALMYAHRNNGNKMDVVDLDPYGTAGPFIDAGVQCLNDGGLLCVTCTDLAVLATVNYPEKCFANYGGIPVKAEYCHEAALRLVLHTISTSAARYGKYIKPMLSLSIDFYVRLFVQVYSAPIEVKKAFSQTALYYVCSGCQSFHEQILGKIVEKSNESSGKTSLAYKPGLGPPTSSTCDECGGVYHIAGPMWSGSLHDKEFTGRLLEHIEKEKDHYGTSARMQGMVTVAHEELDAPFYFTPSKISNFFHCISPSLEDTASAILNTGYQVSRSHACPGSLKTTASRKVILDIFRTHVKNNPVKMENIKTGSPATKLLAKEPEFEASFKRHPGVSSLSKVKLVRYQQNPMSHWGPGTKAGDKKRKRKADE